VKFLKIIVQIIIAALALGLILLLLYGLWRLLTNHWRGILFWAYCAGAAIAFILQLWVLTLMKRIDNPVGQELLYLRLSQAAENASAFQTWRNRLNTLFVALSSALVWPISLLQNARQKRKVMMAGTQMNLTLNMAYQRLYPQDVQLMLMTTVLILLVYATHLIFPLSPETGTRFMLLMALYATIKVASYTVGPVPLAAQLRRGPGNAYVNFLAIALMTYCILTLSFAGFINGVSAVRLDSVVNITLDMLKFRKAYSLIQGGSLAPVDYFITISGFLYYISLFQVLLRITQFKRTDEDYNAIAQSYLMLGKFNEAMAWLGKVKIPNAITFDFKAHAYMGVNQLTKAVEAGKKAHFFRKNEQLDESGTFKYLVNSACIFPLPINQTIHLLEQWLATGVKDTDFMTLSSSLLAQGRVPDEKYKEMLINSPLISKYPLTLTNSLLRTGDTQGAYEVWSSMAPATGTDEVLRRFLALQVLSDGEGGSSQVFESWAAEHLGEMFRVAQEVTDEERLVLFGYLSMLEPLAQRLSSERVEECRFLLQELRNSIATENLKRMTALMTDVFQRSPFSS
jgi:hypothetical protein